MADLVITDSDVCLHNDSAQVELLEAGEVLATLGNLIYKAADGKYYKADTTDATKANATHINVGYANAIGRYFCAVKKGEIDLGSVFTAGKPLFVSNNAGKIADDEPGVGEFTTKVAIPTAADKANFKPDATGVAHG